MTSAYLAALVAVLIDGLLVPSATPALLRGGQVVGPVELIAQFANRVEAHGGVVTADRAGRHCSVRALTPDDPPLFALAPLARCLGAQVSWDGRGKALSIAFARPLPIATMPAYDAAAPRVAPTVVFTPEPAPPTPRVIATGVPRPRRTAIPAVPSWPVASIAPSP